MLSKQAQKDLLKKLKLSDEDIKKYVDGEEETTPELPKLSIYTDEEFSKVKGNIEKSAKEDAESTARDFAMKDLKKHFGIEKEGKKLETVADLIKEHILGEAKQTPQAWDSEKKQMQDKIAELTTTITTTQAEAKKASFTSRLLQSLPNDRNDNIPNEDYLLLLQNRIEVKEDNGKEAIYHNGQKLQNDKFEDLDLKGAIDTIWKQNPAWQKQVVPPPTPIGNGFGDGGQQLPGMISSMKQFKEHCEKNNWNIKGENAQALFNKVTSENKDFVFDEA